MNDGTAGGAIAAMEAAGIDTTTVPTTGQDAELDAVQRILAGSQFMTVYKATKPEAETSAKIAVALANGDPIPTGLIVQQTKTNNGSTDVPSFLLTPQAADKTNIKSVTYGGQPLIGADGYWTPQEVCTAQFQSACQQAGIS
jgi:D-xylose transport system substrate-binding protein